MEICSTISPQQSIHRQKSKMLTIASLRIGMKEKRYASTVLVNVKTEIQIIYSDYLYTMPIILYSR